MLPCGQRYPPCRPRPLALLRLAQGMEAISSGCSLEAAGCRGPVAFRQPQGPIWLAAAYGKRVGLRSPPAGSVRAGLLQFWRVHVSLSTGRNSSPRLHTGGGGVRLRVKGLCAVGVFGLVGRLGLSWGVGLFLAGVCVLHGVGGLF